MRIDMHVHTSRYSECSIMTPGQMAAAAIRSGLDAVVITEHNVMWSHEETQALQAQFPALKLFRGVEVTTAHEDHLLVYGITDDTSFYEGIPAGVLAENVHRDGGIVVLAHPCRYSDKIPEEIFAAGVDGVEMMSNNIRAYMKDGLRKTQKRLDAPCIVNSDAHAVESLGFFANEFRDEIKTERELAHAIMNQAYTIFYDEEKITEVNAHVDQNQAYRRRTKDMRLITTPIWSPSA
jgi:predicted metal-dependent phosphoesterase TrpH